MLTAEEVVANAIRARKIREQDRAWWLGQARKDPKAVEAVINTMQPLRPWPGQQNVTGDSLSPNLKAVCRQLGIEPQKMADHLERKRQEQAAWNSLTPGQQAVCRQLGLKPQEWLDQAERQQREVALWNSLTPEQQSVCRQLGLRPEQYPEQAALQRKAAVGAGTV